MPYQIEIAASAMQHLNALSANDRAMVVHAIEEQLVHEPLVETRNRKPLRPNPIAPWELRVEDLRVFFDVKEQDKGGNEGPETSGTVFVVAIGKKEGSVLRIGDRRVQL